MRQLRVSYVRETALSAVVRTPVAAATLARELIGQHDREHVVVFHLDTKHRVRAFETVAIGALSASVVHPREVFKGAILANAAAIILAHNHPSGDPAPSAEDREITQRLKQAGELLGIPLLDHVIVGDEIYSFTEQGAL